MTHYITDEQIGQIAEQVGLVGPASRVGDCHAAAHRFARAVLALAAPAPQGEPIGEIVRSFSNGSGLDVRLFGRLTSDTPGIVGTKLYTAPAVLSHAEIDFQDDDALRFAQRVLESDAPPSDRKAARDMLVAIRTRVRKAHAAKKGTRHE